MKKNLLTMALIVLGAGSLFTACKKDSGATPGTSLTTSSQLSFGVKTDNSITTFSGTGLAVTDNGGQTHSGSAAVTWTAGTANISGFKLEAKRRNTEVEIKSTAMANIDLFAITPPLISAVIDTGSYTEIEVKVELSKTSGANIPLTLKGTFTPSTGATIPVELDFNEDAEVKVEAQNVTVTGTQNLTTFVDMHLNKLLAGVSISDLNSATLSGGTLVISSTSNTSIYNKVKSNISSCGDSNGFEKHDKSGHDN